MASAPVSQAQSPATKPALTQPRAALRSTFPHKAMYTVLKDAALVADTKTKR